MPQPNLVPGRPATSRTAQSRGMLGSASNVVVLPLRSNEVDMNASAEGRDIVAVDSSSLGPCPILGGFPAAPVGVSRPGASPDHASGRGSRGYSVLDGHLTVHDDVTHAGAQLVRFLESGMVLDGIRIEHYDVGEGARLQAATIFQGQIVCRQRGELAHGLLDADDMVLAHVLREYAREIAVGT